MNLPRLLDILIPRFITTEMAMKQIGRSSLFDIVCCMDAVEPRQRFDGVATITSFSVFGVRLFPSQRGEIRPWVNPHDKAKP